MSATITYKGETLETLNSGEYVTLHTNGKTMEDDIRVELDESSVVPVSDGTAIPAGEVVERIYCNTQNTVAETNAILSQLTYVQTPLFTAPIYPIFAYADPNGNGYTGVFIFAYRMGSFYAIAYAVDLQNQTSFNWYNSDSNGNYYGWRNAKIGEVNLECIPAAIVPKHNGYNVSSLSMWNGLPIGAENEKIKNVLSITPFAAQVEDDPVPTEVATDVEMTALLDTAEIGSVYKYTGESGTYESGALYVVEAVE